MSPTLRLSHKQILLQFSAPVVVTGSPALKLETGVIDREAVWVNASNANITIGGDAVSIVEAVAANPTLVLFEYTVVTGDKSDDLDYWSDEKVMSVGSSFRSASVVLNNL